MIGLENRSTPYLCDLGRSGALWLGNTTFGGASNKIDTMVQTIMDRVWQGQEKSEADAVIGTYVVDEGWS